MKTKALILLSSLSFAFMLLPAQYLNAAEGGLTHYQPGALSTIIDLPPTVPGWVVETAYLHYEGDVSGSLAIPTAGLLAVGLDAASDAVLLGGFYTFSQQVLGAHYSIGGFLPYVWIDAEASVTGPLGNTSYRKESASGIGDITLLPLMMAWKSDSWQYSALLMVYAPTGEYEEGKLANPGLNYWTFDPTAGVSYNNAQNGFNAAVYAGISFNTENEDTNYQSGTVFHLDASVQQLLPLGSGFAGIGIEGFLIEQISGDSGTGASFGDFKSSTAGLGPVLTYLLPVGSQNIVAELRWLAELDTDKHLDGDYIWLKLVWQF
jgi:hypothetical protein